MILLSCPAFEIFYGGAAGGGKSEGLLLDALNQIEKPTYKALFLRRTFAQLQKADGAIERSQKLYRPRGGIYHSGEKRWRFPKDVLIDFGHIESEKDKYNYQSAQYDKIYFDELTQFTNTQYLYLISRCRGIDSTIHRGIRSASNPGNIGHIWAKKRFIDKRLHYKIYTDEEGNTSCFIPATIKDNPYLIENDPQYIKRLKMLPKHERMALLDGNWDIFSGQFFSDWTPSIHIIEPFYIPLYWKRFIGIDYGLTTPASIGWYAQNENGFIVRYREIYKEGLHYDVLAKEICKLSGLEKIGYIVSDPAIFGDKQHHKEAKETKSGAQIMQEEINKYYKEHNRENDAFTIYRGDNRRIEGWRTVKNYLRINDNQQSAFAVFSTCINFISTFPANIHDDKFPEDLDTSGEDHCADEIRYALSSRPQKAILEKKEELNPNSAWGRYLIKQKEKEGFIYGRK